MKKNETSVGVFLTDWDKLHIGPIYYAGSMITHTFWKPDPLMWTTTDDTQSSLRKQFKRDFKMNTIIKAK